MSNLVERTALSDFTLSNMPVGRGQVVTLNPDQLAALAGAGCVYLDATANARVPKADLPPLRDLNAERATLDANLLAQRGAAQEEITRLERALADARERSTNDIAGIERSTAERLEALGREVREAEEARRVRLDAIAAEVTTAEASAREAINAADARAADVGKTSAKSATKA